MKVAICYNGFARNYMPYFYNTKAKLIDSNPDYDFDIYISTWDTINSAESHAYERRNDSNFNSLDVYTLKNLINPVSMQIDKFKGSIFEKYSKYKGVNNTKAVFSQFYKLLQVKQLMEQHIEMYELKYDIVIKLRFDYEILSIIKFQELDMNLFHVEDENGGTEWISDKFSISNLENFKIFTNFYNQIEILMIELGTNIPELLLAEYFKKVNLLILKNKLLNPVSWPPRF